MEDKEVVRHTHCELKRIRPPKSYECILIVIGEMLVYLLIESLPFVALFGNPDNINALDNPLLLIVFMSILTVFGGIIVGVYATKSIYQLKREMENNQ